MRIRVAKSEATQLCLELQMTDMREDEPAFVLEDQLGGPSMPLTPAPAHGVAPEVQESPDQDHFEGPTRTRRLLDTVSAFVGTTLFIVLALLFVLVQIPFLLVENIQKYRYCRRNDLIFSPIRSFIPVPAYSVDSIGALKIFIYTEDHPPPHFHVVTDRYNARFSIDSCEFMGAKGEYSTRHDRAIKNWHARNTGLLAAVWTRTRPSAVGSQ